MIFLLIAGYEHQIVVWVDPTDLAMRDIDQAKTCWCAICLAWTHCCPAHIYHQYQSTDCHPFVLPNEIAKYLIVIQIYCRSTNGGELASSLIKINKVCNCTIRLACCVLKCRQENLTDLITELCTVDIWHCPITEARVSRLGQARHCQEENNVRFNNKKYLPI